MISTLGFKCFGISMTTARGANTFEPECTLHELWNCAQGKEQGGLSDIGFLKINEFCWQRSGELVVLEGFFVLSFPWQELCQTANPQFSNDDECILWRPPFEFESQNSSATPPCNALHFDYQSQAKKKNETEGVGKWTPNSSQQRFPLGNYPGLPPGVNMEIR